MNLLLNTFLVILAGIAFVVMGILYVGILIFQGMREIIEELIARILVAGIEVIGWFRSL